MANFNFNKIILGGRLCGDPELRTTPSGIKVTKFDIAVNRRSGSEQVTDFFNVTAWRGTAEFITRFFRKGSSICIIGSIQTRTWTDDKGNKRSGIDIVADEATFVDGKSDGASAQTTPGAVPMSYMPDAYSAPNLEPIGDDEELPF
jgi:single-strand DNA-binding protein